MHFDDSAIAWRVQQGCRLEISATDWTGRLRLPRAAVRCCAACTGPMSSWSNCCWPPARRQAWRRAPPAGGAVLAAYMRQDIAFHPGRAVVSQRIVGPFLASLFDAVVTVDPHCTAFATLPEAVPAAQAVVVRGAPLLADWIVQQRPRAAGGP